MIQKLMMFVLVAVFALACTNQDLESRLAKLEGKVAELETRSGVKTPMANTPQQQPTTIEPEVRPEGPLPQLDFTQLSHDFGTIQEGEIVTHVFKFKNTGDAPLIISDASATCGCTVPVWPREPIPVGGTGEIKVEFNSRNRPGIQNKTVTITANTFPKVSRLTIKGNVVNPNNPS